MLRFAVPIGAALLLLAAIIFFSYFDSIAQYALESASSSIPGRFRVKRFSPTLAGVQLEGVRWDLGDKDPFFEAEQVDITIDHAALLRRDWLVLVQYARVIKPGLRVTVDPEGNVNLARLLESSEDPQRMDINRLRMVVEFQDGWILYNDRRRAGFLYELSDWKGTAVFPDGERLLLKTEARRKEDESRYRFEGEVSLSRPRLNLGLELARVDLLPFTGFPGFGPGITLLQGAVSGSVMVQGTAEEWKDITDEMFAVGRMEIANGTLAAPWLPVDLKELQGTVELLGREASTAGFTGRAADIAFEASGQADLDPEGEMSAQLSIARFSLDKLKPYLENPPDVKGQVELELEVAGAISDPNVSGKARAYNLGFQGQTASSASTEFLKIKDMVHLDKLKAQTSAGTITGQGWVFLGPTMRVLFALNGSNADPGVVVPDLAQSADFRVRVLGSVDDPLLFGQGQLRGLGSWAQGAGTAEGQFIYTGRDLMLIDGLAFKGSSTVRVPVAAVDVENRQFDGVVSTEGFSLADVPGLSGVAGQVSGRAVVSADFSGETPRLTAQGTLTDGTFVSGGLRADNATGDFAFDGYQMILPDAYASFAGGRVNLAGVFDLRDQALAFNARGESINLGSFGLPGENANLIGAIFGRLGGELGVYGYADSGRGRAALSAFQRPNGTVGGVAWVDGAMPGQDGSSVQAVVVADGSLDRLNMEYTGTARTPLLADLGPLDVYGGASLAGRVLTIRPTLVTARAPGSRLEPVPFVTYSGAAYPFFGPLLAGPLKKVVVEEQVAPSDRALLFSGQANLADQSLDVRFDMRAANLEELAQQPLGQDPEAASFNESMPFDVLSGFGNLRGVVSGTFAAPTVQADYHVPWLLLANGYENRQAMSSKGQVSLSGQALQIRAAAVSETPYDQRLSLAGMSGRSLYEMASRINGLLAARGVANSDGSFDLRLATAGFDASFLSLVSPETYRRYLPYGRLATDNLHVWGSAASPSLAGAIRLVQGGVLMAGEAFPFENASLSFSSQGGETRVENLVLSAPGLDITGYGKRSANGELSGQIAANDVELDKLRALGPPFSGLSGVADAVVEVRGRLPGRPRLEIAARGRDLTWNPAAIGGASETVSIEELALGHFNDDETLALGAVVAQDQTGLVLELPERGLRFRTAAGGLSLEAEGAVRFPGGLPDLRMFKTFSDWGRYFVSPNGPDFGQTASLRDSAWQPAFPGAPNVPGQPFEVRAENWSFAELGRLLGRSAPPYRVSGTSALALEGQWWRDHEREAQGSLPRYGLSMDSLVFEGEREGHTSGFELQSPSLLSYQREGDAAYLGLQNLSLGFFSYDQVAPDSDAAPTGEEVPEPATAIGPVNRQGSLQAEARLALAQLPEAAPVSRLSLGAVDIPLGNLAFLLPEQVTLDGLVESIEVGLDGLLPTPQLNMTALVTDLSLGPLREMTFRGKLSGAQDSAGGYRISLGDEAEPSVTLSFGTTDAADHQMQAQGEALLQWQRTEPMNPSRLSLFSQGLEISPNSPIDMAATVVDKGLRVISDAVPGEDQGRGDLFASLGVTGTLGYPEFEGKASLVDGSFRSQRYGNFEALQLDATVERIARDEAEQTEVLRSVPSGWITRFRLPRLEGTLGKKPFFGGGQAEFAGVSPTLLDLFFVGEALPIKLPDLFTGTADVDFELTGRVRQEGGRTSLSPVVLGTVVIPQGQFDVPTGAVEGEGQGLALPLDYDVTIDLGQEFYARMYGSTVRAVGEVRLLSDQGQPKLYGRVDLSRGEVRIPFYDASFRIRHGVAYFEGPMIPRLENVEAVADLGGYRIVARVDGVYPDQLSVNLFSDPPLPQAELSRLVVLGGLPGQFSGMNDPSQGGSSIDLLSGTGVSFLSGMLTNRVTEQIGKIFLLSEVSFDYIPPASYVIKLAKALDPDDNFLLTLTRVIRDNGLNENLYGIEWRLTQTFLTRVALDQYNRLRFWVQSINRF